MNDESCGGWSGGAKTFFSSKVPEICHSPDDDDDDVDVDDDDDDEEEEEDDDEEEE